MSSRLLDLLLTGRTSHPTQVSCSESSSFPIASAFAGMSPIYDSIYESHSWDQDLQSLRMASHPSIRRVLNAVSLNCPMRGAVVCHVPCPPAGEVDLTQVQD